MSFLSYLIPFLIVLGVVVFVHEFGHFIVGRWCGVKVDAFSLGFGPELFAFEDSKGTRWRIAAIPLGGFVKFHGDANGASMPDPDQLDKMSAAERSVTFYGQNVWKRAAIVFAGPAANFLLAISLYTAFFAANGQIIHIPKVATVMPGTAAEEAGFRSGDIVLSIDGAEIPSFDKLFETVQVSAGKALIFKVLRDGAETELTATPRLHVTETLLGKAKTGLLGVQASADPADLRHERYGLVDSLGLAVDETWNVVARTYHYVARLAAGRESADQLSGPIGIAQVSGQMAQAISTVGVWPFFNLIAILSVSIGLLNLMPVPLLDGGHLAFFAIEALRGRALNERTQEYAFRVGLAMVCSLMLFSTYNDVARLIRKFAGLDS